MNIAEKPLKIGILLRNRHDGPGGLEKVLETLAGGMQDKPVELYFYTLFPPKYTGFTKEFKNYRTLGIASFWGNFENILPHSLKRVIRKINVKFNKNKLFDQMIDDHLDVLITMDLSKQFISNYPALKRFKEKSGIPVFSWIHISLTGGDPVIAKQAASKIDLFDGHLAISEGLSLELKKDYLAQNIALIYNPVDGAELVPRDKRKFIYVGRITKIKRVESMIQHLSALRGNWLLDVYGSTGNSRDDQAFSDLIKSLDLEENINFHGWKSNAWDHIDSAGILLLNSMREGFGLVIVEAMQRGIPVISADCPVGPSELIKPGENGWLYPVEEESQLVDLLQCILDGALILPEENLVKNSVNRFETSVYIDNFLKEIRSLLKMNIDKKTDA